MPCSAKFRNQNFQISSSFSFMIIRLCPPLIHLFPIHFRKIDMTTKILEVWSDFPLPPMMPWLLGFTWYAWPYNDIFHIPHLTIVFFWETLNICKSSARIESQPKLYLTTKTDSFWDLGEWKKVPWPAACPMYPSLLSASPGKDK